MLDYISEPLATPACEDDYVLWLNAQVELLRNGRLELLDRSKLIDQLTAMARHERRSLNTRLEVLITHLLKWQFQPDHKTLSWERTVDEQRKKIEMIIEDSPSLRNTVQARLDKCYERALRHAMKETGLPASHFPRRPPFTVEQLLDFDFYP